jgi:ABC-2 type transport system ATP-binding protein
MISLNQVTATAGGFRLHIEFARFRTGLSLLVGRNGSGKSTLLRLLATVQSPDSGEIRYGSRNVRDALPVIRSRIGYVPSGLDIYEEMTPYRFLSYMSELKGRRDRDEIGSLLARFGLERLKNKKIGDLSHGQRQKTAIAQAFIGSPYVLLLDEPLQFLDSLERRSLVSALIRYSGSRIVIVATHEWKEWDFEPDKLLWIDDGNLQFDGPLELWLRGLPMAVWEGSVSADRIGGFDPDRIAGLSIREDGTAMLRVLSVNRPFPGFTEAAATTEDAYLIRSLEAKTRKT